MKQHFLFDCPKYITYRTTLHNIIQEAKLDDAKCYCKNDFSIFFMLNNYNAGQIHRRFTKTSCLNLFFL